MISGFFNFIKDISFGYALLFYVCLIVIKVACFICLNVKKIRKIEKVKKRKGQYESLICSLYIAFCLLVQNFALQQVVGGLFTLIALVISLEILQTEIEKVAINRSNQKDEKTNFFERDKGVIERSKKILSTIKTSVMETKKSNEQESENQKESLNFSHVKNILKKLSNYSLNQTEKRQVEELSESMYFLENGQETKETKDKLNDGLNSLLKIMAKYSV